MAEKTLRSVVCQTHGLRYNPETQAGCARCRRQDTAAAGLFESAAPRRSGPPLLVWIVGGSVLAAVLLAITGGGPPAIPEPDPAPSVAPDRVAPPPPRARSRATPAESPAHEPVVPASHHPDAPQTDDGFRLIAGEGRVTIDDRPEDEPFMVGDKVAPDVRGVTFNADGDSLLVHIQLEQSISQLAYDFALGFSPAALFFDLDNDSKTGERGFAGRVGFELTLETSVGVRYDRDSDSYFWAGGREAAAIVDFACSHGIEPMVSMPNPGFYRAWDDEPKQNTSCSGNTLSLRVSYDRLGVEPGQVVRIATEESMGSGKVAQYYLDDALLTF